MFGGPWSEFGRHGRRFEKGDFKYVILDLLKDKSRHGYEIMRAIEERFGGLYTASPGTVYPTLQMLEDLGYVSATELDGKKVYTITAEGRKFLEERGEVVDDIWSRVGDRWDPSLRAEWQEMKQQLKDLGRTFSHGPRGYRLNREKLNRVRATLTQAARDIEAILSE